MKNVKMTICLVVAVLFMVVEQGLGNVQFNDGAIHNINYQINDMVDVDVSSPSIGTTVNLLAGGTISTRLYGYNDSSLNISGGSVGGYGVFTADRSHVSMSSGSVPKIVAYGNSAITLSGGSVTSYLQAADNSRVTMSGGTVQGSFQALNSSQVVISGGSMDSLILTEDHVTVRLSGGTISSAGIQVRGSLIISGSNFAIDGSPVGFARISSILGGAIDRESYRQITGTLANGDILNTKFRIGDLATITLVPEPTTLVLLGFGGMFLRKR